MISMRSLVFTCFASLLSVVSYAQTDIAMVGIVSVWEKSCAPNGSCGIPYNVGDENGRVVSLNLTQPAIGALTDDEVITGQGTYRIQVQGFRRRGVDEADPNAPNENYIVFQVKLSSVPYRTIAECAYYSRADVTEFFPVGSCSGLNLDGSIQAGVTFRRLPH